MGIQQGFGYWSGREGVGLDKNGAFGFNQFPDVSGLFGPLLR